MKYALLALSLAACGSKTPASTTTATTTASAPDAKRPPLPAGLKWEDMDLDQRHQFMEDTVLPETKKLFVAFDASTYSGMDCATCHGPGVEDGTFEMPNPKIKPLPNTPEAFMAWVKKDERAAKYAQFMSQELEPKMGELLQVKLFDPKTGTPGFSCSSCHYLVDDTGKVFKEPSREDEHEHEHEHGGEHEHEHQH